MLRAMLFTFGLCGALALAANAADGTKKQRQLTEEQKTVLKEMTDKYDKDKDGKLSAEERKAMSAEDKDKMTKAGLGPRKKKTDK
jgi:ABC-type transporter MlaC component